MAISFFEKTILLIILRGFYVVEIGCWFIRTVWFCNLFFDSEIQTFIYMQLIDK